MNQVYRKRTQESIVQTSDMVYCRRMRIRRLKKREITQALTLIVNNYSSEYRRSARSELAAMFQRIPHRPYFLVAEEKKGIIGLAGFVESWMDDDICEIWWVNVEKSFQRQGLGKQLMKQILTKAKQKQYTLAILSTTLPRFYRTFGFKTYYAIPQTGYTVMGVGLK